MSAPAKSYQVLETALDAPGAKFALENLTKIGGERFIVDAKTNNGKYFMSITSHEDNYFDTEAEVWKEEAESFWQKFFRVAMRTEKKTIEKAEISGRRWLQFLNGVDDLITESYREKDGKLKIEQLAKDCGCELASYKDMSELETELKKDLSELESSGLSESERADLLKFKERFAKAKKEKKRVDGVSLPKKKKIFYWQESIAAALPLFAIAHELSHFLLGHNAFICGKNHGEPLFERTECGEEADKLAAIMLMPHAEIRRDMKISNRKLAKRYGVPVKAIKKRKQEIDIERNILCYGRYSEKSQSIDS